MVFDSKDVSVIISTYYTVIIHHLLLHRLTGWITQQSKYQNRTKKTVAWELTVLRQCVDVDGLTSLIHHIKIDTKNTMTVRTKYKGGCIHCDIVIDLREGRRKEERKEEKMAVSTNQCVSLSLSLYGTCDGVLLAWDMKSCQASTTHPPLFRRILPA